MTEEAVGFRLRETYLLGTILGVFFAYITTACWIPTYLGKKVALAPWFVYLIWTIEIIGGLIGFPVGYKLGLKAERRKKLMILGGFMSGILSMVSFIPAVEKSLMAVSLLKIFTTFSVCLCLCPWAFIVAGLVPMHRMREQMHAILTISAAYGTVTPIVLGYLLSISREAFHKGWMASSALLLLMGLCSMFMRIPKK